MMRDDFWQGLVCGSIIAMALTVAVAPMVMPRKKPLLEQGKEALTDTARDFAKQAKRAQHRFMERIG